MNRKELLKAEATLDIMEDVCKAFEIVLEEFMELEQGLTEGITGKEILGHSKNIVEKLEWIVRHNEATVVFKSDADVESSISVKVVTIKDEPICEMVSMMADFLPKFLLSHTEDEEVRNELAESFFNEMARLLEITSQEIEDVMVSAYEVLTK